MGAARGDGVGAPLPPGTSCAHSPAAPKSHCPGVFTEFALEPHPVPFPEAGWWGCRFHPGVPASSWGPAPSGGCRGTLRVTPASWAVVEKARAEQRTPPVTQEIAGAVGDKEEYGPSCNAAPLSCLRPPPRAPRPCRRSRCTGGSVTSAIKGTRKQALAEAAAHLEKHQQPPRGNKQAPEATNLSFKDAGNKHLRAEGTRPRSPLLPGAC